ncbi:efflux RND transporter periplasmic adaptor subunit [Pedomonas sp. V897]|uniref:efflux RND transporter periplasmic adaptor subunit n=1 Tax=Pedomonas sp. V897 TaxID=3446482 RepID=UPI003EE3E303
MSEIMPVDAPPAAKANSRTLKRYGIAAAVVALGIVAIGTASRLQATNHLREVAAEAAIPVVAVVTPETDIKGNVLTLPGNVEAFNTAPIYARTNGYVRRWLVNIGDRVKAGQTLAVLDAPEIEQQLAQALADYQTAKANQQLAATTAERWRALVAEDAVSRQEADEKAGDLAAKTALAEAAQANVRRLQALHGFTQLVAPFDGVITSRSAQIGALVVAGASAEPLFTVSDTHRMRIYVRVPQNYSAQVKTGTSANLTLPEFPGRTFPAKVTRSAGAVDPQSGAVLVELQADNADGALKPGAFAQVQFDLDDGGTQGLRLPGSTVLYSINGPVVAVVDDKGKVTIKPVTIARDEGRTVIVSAGVEPTDRVIDSPPDAIQSGDEVKVQAATATPAKGAAHAG